MDTDKLLEKIQKTSSKYISTEEFNTLLKDTTEAEIEHLKGFDSVQVKLLVYSRKTTKSKLKLEVAQIVAGDQWNEYQNRLKIMQMAGVKSAESGKNVVGVFLVSEAWVAKEDENTDESEKSKAPSERKDKQEVLMIAGRTIDGRSNMSMAEVKTRLATSMSFHEPEYIEYNEKVNYALDNDLLNIFFKGYIVKTAINSLSSQNDEK